MSKKTFIIILVLSVVVTYLIALIQFSSGGLPFRFSSFNLLGSETNVGMLILDIVFWFIILFGVWTLIKKLFSK